MNVRRILALLLAVFLCAALFAGCSLLEDNNRVPDKTGSWGQISETIQRGEDWQQIVSDSEFALGETYVKGQWYIGENETEDYYGIGFGTYPNLDGSTVAVPMAAEFARQHLGFSDEDANSMSMFYTTHEAYVHLITKSSNASAMIQSTGTFLDDTHPVDLIIATEPSYEELALAKEKGVTLVTKPVCYDAFVFITHKDNPVDSLTEEQIQKIYAGEITNWSEVGGDDLPIAAYQREENSGSQTAMLNLVMKGVPMMPPPTVRIVMGMGGLIDVVAEYQNDGISIGYTYKYYIDALYKNDNIKVLSVEGLSPSEENLRSGAYLYTTAYYGVIRGGEEKAAGGKFLTWMLSLEGQQCIQQAGYLPYMEL